MATRIVIFIFWPKFYVRILHVICDFKALAYVGDTHYGVYICKVCGSFAESALTNV